MKLTFNDKVYKNEKFGDLPIGQAFRWVAEASAPSILIKASEETAIIFGYVYQDPRLVSCDSDCEVIRYTIDEIIAHRS